MTIKITIENPFYDNADACPADPDNGGTFNHESGDFCESCGHEEIEVPGSYEVCGRCQGKGTHVNPNVDGHGISSEEFDEDPDFREDYFSGVYDVACHQCVGKRVVPAIDYERLERENPRLYKAIRDSERDKREYAAECAAERRFGC